MWCHNHRTRINWSDYLSFHTFEKEERIEGWQLKELIITWKEKERGLGPCMPRNLYWLAENTIFSQDRGNPEGLLTANFQKTFFLLSLPWQSPPWWLWDSRCHQGRPGTHIHGFQEFHPLSPAVTLLPLLNLPFPDLQPYQARLSHPICAPIWSTSSMGSAGNTCWYKQSN